jgi:hypothetical protein
MPRITCKTPSTGRPVTVRIQNVGTSWTTVAEAPDFSVPDTSLVFPTRDPGDASRAIRSGEVFMLTPLYARNKTSTTRWVEARILNESGTAFTFARITVPANETAAIPVQGMSLVKRTAAGADGDRLQLRAEAGSTFDVWGAAEEKPTSEHIGVEV